MRDAGIVADSIVAQEAGELEPCPECGAWPIERMNCDQLLEIILTWERDDPDLRAGHFLLVASYNLQHPAQFTRRAAGSLQDAFVQHLDHGTPVRGIRRRIASRFGGSSRARGRGRGRAPQLRPWSMTIRDVYYPGYRKNAADRVRAWARSIRRELPATDSSGR